MHNWQQFLQDQSQQPYFIQLMQFLQKEYQAKRVYPDHADVFRALQLSPFESTKAVIVGQDPYHQFGQANGLAFSVPAGRPLPPSLRNIFHELVSDICCPFPKHGDLTHWAQQGVLLLNTTLTVRESQPGSHVGYGWETLTRAVVQALAQRAVPPVFLLWGKHAQQFRDITGENTLVAPHPSPLSAHRGFLGCRHFSQTNMVLKQRKMAPIQWQLPSLPNPKKA